MAMHQLTCHPANLPVEVRAISASLVLAHPDWATLRFRIEGAGALVVPPLAGRVRRDNLWATTCFEMFAAPGAGPAYQEWNLSPSEAFAAYGFGGYRAEMAQLHVRRPPIITWRGNGKRRLLDAALPLGDLPAPPFAYGLCAVVEEAGGRFSYWALSHAGDRPDFHDPACFAGLLEARQAP
jgi:hypothetical protein